MAKYERSFQRDFHDFLETLNEELENSSLSVSCEDSSDITMGNIKVAVRVYERYSMAGGNRVSLNVTVVGNENDIIVSAITSGGSQAVFFKINTWGEESFLEVCSDVVEKYIARQR